MQPVFFFLVELYTPNLELGLTLTASQGRLDSGAVSDKHGGLPRTNTNSYLINQRRTEQHTDSGL